MNHEQAGQEHPLPDRLPQRIYEGMPVYDSQDEVVGTVSVMYYGGASEEAIQRALQAEEAPAAGNMSPFDADKVSKELRARFMRQGYILVEGPDLTGAKRYIGPEQIEGVFSLDVEGRMVDALRLRIMRAELINAA